MRKCFGEVELYQAQLSLHFFSFLIVHDNTPQYVAPTSPARPAVRVRIVIDHDQLCLDLNQCSADFLRPPCRIDGVGFSKTATRFRSACNPSTGTRRRPTRTSSPSASRQLGVQFSQVFAPLYARARGKAGRGFPGRAETLPAPGRASLRITGEGRLLTNLDTRQAAGRINYESPGLKEHTERWRDDLHSLLFISLLGTWRPCWTRKVESLSLAFGGGCPAH
jgi:hypothetical protein